MQLVMPPPLFDYMSPSLPQSCFISHSYRDQGPLQALLASLPREVRPFLFPPITVTPDQLVSNSLINAILANNGLVHLMKGYSERSFWVAFERDYGLRAKRQVFSFDPEPPLLAPDEASPRELYVYPCYARPDHDHIERILRHMTHDRHFNVFVDAPVVGDQESTLQRVVRSWLDRGAYIVLFWSANALRSRFIEQEIHWAREHPANRVLVALLEDIEAPAWSTDAPAHLQPVQLFGDTQLSETNRWDDLIVRLYWLVYFGQPNGNLE